MTHNWAQINSVVQSIRQAIIRKGWDEVGISTQIGRKAISPRYDQRFGIWYFLIKRPRARRPIFATRAACVTLP